MIMSRNRCNTHTGCVREITGPQRITIHMSSGAVVRERGWTLANRTFVAHPALGTGINALTVEIYLLARQAVLVRVYHRAEGTEDPSAPVQVQMDVTGCCGTVGEAVEFLAGLGWPAPVVDTVRDEARERRGEVMRSRWAKTPSAHGTREGGFTILEGSIFRA